MNTIKVPFIEGIEKMSYEEMDMAMETGAAKSFIGCVNWQEYPYRPDVAFSVARSRTHLAVLYHVRGLDLRAMAMEDNGNVWEDSCCEFFAADPSDGTYYNFEMNCIGTLLASKRKNRQDFRYFGKDELGQVVRHSSLERKEYGLTDGPYSWQTAICIPFSLVGINPDNLPGKIRANFYKCADKSAHPHFLSWNPVEIPEPDFHRPDYFGELLF